MPHHHAGPSPSVLLNWVFHIRAVVLGLWLLFMDATFFLMPGRGIKDAVALRIEEDKE